MSDQPHYPYRDGDRAVLGPEVIATADGMTIRWKGANYRRDHGEHVGHVYLSTGCFHGQHNYCQSNTGLAGAKKPKTCKWCPAVCICPCHQPEESAAAPAATEATEPATVTDPEYLRQQYAAALREHGMVHLGDQVPADEYDCCAEAVLAVHDGYVRQLQQRLELADQLVSENTELHRYHAEDRDQLTEMRATITRLRGEREQQRQRADQLAAALDQYQEQP